MIDDIRFLYCFDRDGTVDSSGGPVPIALIRQLRAQGHAVWAHGNQVLCKEAGIPGFVDANRLTGRNVHDEEISAGAELRRDRLRAIRSLFPEFPAICIDDMDLSELQGEGWIYYSPDEFVSLMQSMPSGPLWFGARQADVGDPIIQQLRTSGTGRSGTEPCEQLRSRYIRQADDRADQVAGLRLPVWWWSRPYEYAWAIALAAGASKVLDAGCGVSHPLKWALVDDRRVVHACDIDERIVNPEQVNAALQSDFGIGHQALMAGAFIPTIADVQHLPFPDASFDRIFCVGVLEHMSAPQRLRALKEFNRILQSRKSSAVALTVAVPAVDPRALLDLAWQAGLEPVGQVDLTVSEDTLRHGAWGVRAFRAVLRQR